MVRKFMEYGGESIFRGENLANHVKVTEDNYPDVFRIFLKDVKKFDIKMPELYVYNEPVINAYTCGEPHTFVAISIGAVDTMAIEELKGIMAHECGHIVCHHTFYNMLLMTIVNAAEYFKGLPYLFFGPFYLILMYWSRKSEFSADRCVTLIVGVDTFQKTLVRLASGLKEIIPVGTELLEQSHEYRDLIANSTLQKIQLNCRMAFYSHPQLCEKAHEVDRWGKSRIFCNLI